MSDKETDYLKLPLPWSTHTLDQDLPRLQQALRLIDAFASSANRQLTEETAAWSRLISELAVQIRGEIAEAADQVKNSVALSFSNVDNTSDRDKPVSTAQQAAIDNEVARSYGKCDTAAGTAAKVGTIDGFVRRTGSTVGLKFTYANTAANPTLNVNSTGAAAIYHQGAYIAADMIPAGHVALFQFNGSQWELLNPVVPEVSYGACATAAGTAAKVGTIDGFVRRTGSTVGLKFTYANTAASPTLNVNGSGAAAIYHQGGAITSEMIPAGHVALFQFNGSQWELLNPSVSGAVPGEFRLWLHRKTELPAGWYYPSGDYVAQSTLIGQALLALPANLKSDWGIITSGTNIRLCDNTKFFSGVYGRFPRMASGNSAAYYPGVVESDAIRNIKSGAGGIGGRTGFSVAPPAPFYLIGNRADGQGHGSVAGAGPYFGFDASLLVPTSDENRPYSVYMTPAIYLGV